MKTISVKHLLWIIVFSFVLFVLFFSHKLIVPTDESHKTDTEKPGVVVMWKKPAADFRSCAFTEGGNYYTMVKAGGVVSLYHYSGVKKFETRVKDADSAISTKTGTMTMAYNRMNPLKTTVTFLDSSGKKVSTMDVGGSIWCADSWGNNLESRFVVGTGRRQVYCIIYDSNGRRYNRWRAPGVVCSVGFEKDGYNILYGTWQKSFLLRSTRRGTVRWSTAVDPAALPQVANIDDDSRWRALIVPNRQGSDAILRQYTDEGNEIWETPIEGKNNARVLVSNSGTYTCIGYEKQILHSGDAITEYRAKLLDTSGHVLWDKGSMFLHIKPLAVTDDGVVLSCSTDGKMHIIDSYGNVNSTKVLGGEVTEGIWAPGADRILALCTDGNLYMLELTTIKKEQGLHTRNPHP